MPEKNDHATQAIITRVLSEQPPASPVDVLRALVASLGRTDPLPTRTFYTRHAGTEWRAHVVVLYGESAWQESHAFAKEIGLGTGPTPEDAERFAREDAFRRLLATAVVVMEP